MSAEERLRDVLRAEASTLTPEGDGLARIQARLARRRRVRWWLVPSAAVVTAGLAAAVFLVAPGGGHGTQSVVTGSTPSSSPMPTPSELGPDDGGMPLEAPAIWPFTSQAEAASWQSSYPWAQDGLEVGRHFVADYLGLSGVDVSQPCVSCGVLVLDTNGTRVGEVKLARIGVGFASGHGTQVYTVVLVGGTDLTVTSPQPGATVSSPTTVTGRIVGVDENVALRLVSEAGDTVASGSAPAGSAVPWSTTLTWTALDWSHGAIVGVTRSPKDGSVNRLVAVPVGNGSAPRPTP